MFDALINKFDSLQLMDFSFINGLDRSIIYHFGIIATQFYNAHKLEYTEELPSSHLLNPSGITVSLVASQNTTALLKITRMLLTLQVSQAKRGLYYPPVCGAHTTLFSAGGHETKEMLVAHFQSDHISSAQTR